MYRVVSGGENRASVIGALLLLHSKGHTDKYDANKSRQMVYKHTFCC